MAYRQGESGLDEKQGREKSQSYAQSVADLCRTAPSRAWNLRILAALSRGQIIPNRNFTLRGLARFTARQVNYRAPGLFRLIADNRVLRGIYRRATSGAPVARAVRAEIAPAPLTEYGDPILRSLHGEMIYWKPGKRIDG